MLIRTGNVRMETLTNEVSEPRSLKPSQLKFTLPRKHPVFPEPDFMVCLKPPKPGELFEAIFSAPLTKEGSVSDPCGDVWARERRTEVWFRQHLAVSVLSSSCSCHRSRSPKEGLTAVRVEEPGRRRNDSWVDEQIIVLCATFCRICCLSLPPQAHWRISFLSGARSRQ